MLEPVQAPDFRGYAVYLRPRLEEGEVRKLARRGGRGGG